MSKISETPWGEIRGQFYYPRKRHAGFFSQCTTSLVDFTSITDPISKIVARRAFSEYRSFPGVNSWSIFFRQPRRPMIQATAGACFSVSTAHAEYSSLNFGELSPYVNHYFRLSERLEKRVEFFRSRYHLFSRNLVAVNIRGTDKYTEIPPAPIENYLSAAEEGVRKVAKSKILLVTDQTQFVTRFRSEFGERLSIVNELPTTSSNSVIHERLKRSQRQIFGINFLAMMSIVATASKVITHTGNGALWTALFRGSCRDLLQLRGTEVFGEI